MKKFLLATILILGSLSIFATCGSNCPLTNAALACVSGFDTNPANIYARVWVQGLNDPTEGVGTDSDGMASVDTTCDWGGTSGVLMAPSCAGLSADEYIIMTDWLAIPYDGCPTAAGTNRAVLLAYDTSGKYVLESRLRSEGWTNWDAIGTIPAAPLNAETCAADPDGTGPLGPIQQNGANIDVTFTAFPASVLYGSYNGAAPSIIPTQFRVYFLESAAAPANFATGAWVAGNTYPIGTTSVTNMPYPTLVNPNNRLYMSRSLIFEGTELPFVSQSPTILWQGNPPAGAGVIASSSANKSGIDTVVNWTSNDETMVTSYQIYWAPQGSSDFAVIGNVVNPQGNNHTYTATVRIPSQGSYTVKVGANLTDGTVEYSSPMNISSSVIIKNKARVVPN